MHPQHVGFTFALKHLQLLQTLPFYFVYFQVFPLLQTAGLIPGWQWARHEIQGTNQTPGKGFLGNYVQFSAVPWSCKTHTCLFIMFIGQYQLVQSHGCKYWMTGTTANLVITQPRMPLQTRLETSPNRVKLQLISIQSLFHWSPCPPILSGLIYPSKEIST